MTEFNPKPVPKTASMPILSLKNISKSYGGRLVLSGLNLEIKQGERVALLGSNGSGKTTLLKICLGLETPDAGQVRLFGEDLSLLKRKMRGKHIGGMPQNLDLVENLMVKNNIQAGLLAYWGFWRSLLALVGPFESPVARRQAAGLGLEHLFYKRTSDLSRGERQLVALARLLVQSPSLMLLDEPTASLDPERSRRILAYLSEMAGSGEMSGSPEMPKPSKGPGPSMMRRPSKVPGPSNVPSPSNVRRSAKGPGPSMMRRPSKVPSKTFLASLHSPDLAIEYFDRAILIQGAEDVLDIPISELQPDILKRLYQN